METSAAAASVRMRRREAAGLAMLIVAALAGFAFTRAVAAANRRMHLDDASRWAQLAAERLSESRPDAAVAALRRAVAIDRDNQSYRLKLASALAASGQDEGARQVLAALRQLAPEDPHVNIELARLEARRHDVTAAVQFYQNALYGLWPPDRIEQRRSVRRELVDFLLASGQTRRALSELLILSGNVPDEPESQRQMGALFLAAGDPRRALDHFNEALRLAPADEGALAGAGEAAFIAGDYAQARRDLRRAHGLPDRLADMRAVADQVVSSDPLAPGLALAERARRLRAGLDRARQRLDLCPGDVTTARSELNAFADGATLRALRDDPDVIEAGVVLIGRLLQQASSCGPESAADRGWRAIVARHGAGEE